MPEHVHLLVNEPPEILLGQFLKVFKQAASRELKGERERFWQRRYFDANIRGEEARSEVIQYIHRNPVKRGLVERPENYRWSSYNHYATGVRGTVEIESEWTARWRQARRRLESLSDGPVGLPKSLCPIHRSIIAMSGTCPRSLRLCPRHYRRDRL